MSNDLVVVEKFLTEPEALTAQAYLEQAGVESFIEGTASTNALFYAGVVSIRLLVHQRDASVATAALRDFLGQSAAPDQQWYCGECSETNEGTFDVCWKCHQPRNQVEKEFPKSETSQSAGDSLTHEQAEISNPDHLLNLQNSKNGSYTANQADEVIAQAFRSAVLGIGVPIVLTGYSIVLLLGSYDCTEPLSESTKRKRNWAWLFNLFVIACQFGIVIIWVAGQQ